MGRSISSAASSCKPTRPRASAASRSSFGTFEELIRGQREKPRQLGHHDVDVRLSLLPASAWRRSAPSASSAATATARWSTTHAGAHLSVWTRARCRTSATPCCACIYDDPERIKCPGERIEVTAPSAKSIKRQAADQRRGLVHPAYRKRQTVDDHSAHRARLRLHALEDRPLHGPDDGRADGTAASSTAWAIRNREWDLQIRNAQNGSPRCCLAWMDANELLADLRGFLAGFDDAGLRPGRSPSRSASGLSCAP